MLIPYLVIYFYLFAYLFLAMYVCTYIRMPLLNMVTFQVVWKKKMYIWDLSIFKEVIVS